MRKAIFLWWLSFFLFLFFWTSGQNVVYAQLKPDEEVVNCYRGESRCIPGTGNSCYDGPSDYIDAQGNKQSEYRSDAGLNWNTAVRGAGCGEVKSSPLVIQETVSYPGPDKGGEWSACTYKPSWGAEITMNYDFSGVQGLNLYVPFAEEMADEWAGTMDTEHLSVNDYDNLVTRANQNVGVSSTGYLSMAALEDKIKAQSDINQKDGVLRKLLTSDQQDALKCSFANWAARRHNAKDAAGNPKAAPSLYLPLTSGEPYYKPDDKVIFPLLGGDACRNVACPTTSSDPNYNRGKCLNDYDDGTTLVLDPNHGGYYAPGPAWQKMALIPNEKTLSSINYYVCGFDMFPQYVFYPEVFRMGLAANELYKIFTDKPSQDTFYNKPEFASLKGDPLANLFPAGSITITSIQQNNNNFQAQSTNEQNVKQIPAKPIQQPLTSQQKFVKNIFSLITKYIPKVKTVLAKTAVNIKIQKPSVKQLQLASIFTTEQPVLLAQASGTNCGPNDPVLQASVSIKPGSGSEYGVTLTRTDCGKQALPGLLGHVRLYQDVSGSAGTPHDFYIPEISCNKNGDRAGCDILTFTPKDLPLVLPTFSSEAELRQWLNKGLLKIRADYFNIDPTSLGADGIILIYKQIVGTSLAGRCDALLSCCTTADCGPATCAPCQNTQVGPSKTSVWPKGYPASHQYLGDGDASTGEFKDPVVYSFKPSKGDCKFEDDVDSDGLKTVCGSDAACGGGSCGPDNHCGHWSCQKTHDRVVNVYNNVPFLGSVWAQIADPGTGFMAAMKPAEITGTGIISGQLTQVGSKGNEHEISQYVGCTSDESMILNPFGDFVPETASTRIDYGFGIKRLNSENDANITVSLREDTALGQINFYRLGGSCNVNKWWTEKVLNPMLKNGLTASGAQQYRGIITACASKNVTIHVSSYYDGQCNESLAPQTGFTQGVTILQGQQTQ